MTNTTKKRKEFLYHASNDMEEAIEAARLLEVCRSNSNTDGRNHQRIKALETALVISYARPFTKSNFYEKLSDPDINHLTDLEKGLHKKICDLRDGRYAHTDADSKSGRTAGVFENGLEGVKGYTESLVPLDIDMTTFTAVCEKNRELWRKLADTTLSQEEVRDRLV